MIDDPSESPRPRRAAAATAVVVVCTAVVVLYFAFPIPLAFVPEYLKRKGYDTSAFEVVMAPAQALYDRWPAYERYVDIQIELAEKLIP